MSEAHAPGKLVICGEYAVLHGAPAIAVAVDVRARVRIRAGSAPSRLIVPDEGSWLFDLERGALRWREPPPAGQGRILEAAATALAARGIEPTNPVEIVLDSRAFRTTRGDGAWEKLGLGSSAAITVALVGALVAHAGQSALRREALFELCAAIHRGFQGGKGSGVDVAAAVYGGVIALTAERTAASVRALAWPPGLHWLAAWSGEAAATMALLGRFEAFLRADPVRFERHVCELGALAATTLGAWERGDVALLLESLADYDDALRALDDGARIGIYTPAHRRLAAAAGEAGAVYKTSGAGGGDFGVAFADSPEVIARLSATLAESGVRTMPGAAGTPGLQVEI